MRFETINSELDGHVLTITLDRPRLLNAFIPAMGQELAAAFDRADEDDEVRAVIVTGAGRAFCAGADLSGGASAFQDTGPVPTLADGTPRDSGGLLTLRIFESRKPVIAAINGPAVGVGVTMTLPMDIRLAADGARLGLPFTRRGIAPDGAASWFLPRVVGISQALEWITTGRLFDAREAREGGLVKEVLPAGELLDAAHALAAEIGEQAAPVSVALSRRLLWSMLAAPNPETAHEIESRALDSRGRSLDAREGIEAFLQKRPAVFADRVSAGLPGFDEQKGTNGGKHA